LEEIVVTFREGSQGIGALREAAYRLIGKASCHIDTVDGFHTCRLTPAKGARPPEADLRARFLDLVTDENLREKLRIETSPTRDLIVALAFGALAEQAGSTETS